jgi:hypothetical protein
MLSSFFSFQALIALWIPGAIFSGMCLLVVVLAVRLPESTAHELPTTIAECNKMDKDKRVSLKYKIKSDENIVTSDQNKDENSEKYNENSLYTTKL